MPRVLLTAAHCLYDTAMVDGQPRKVARQLSDMGVVFGVNSRNPRRITSISRTAVYPGFNPQAYFCKKGNYVGEKPAFCARIDFEANSGKDIAIVFLAEDAPAGTKPVTPYMGEVDALNTVFAGYGLTRNQDAFKTAEQTRPYTGILHAVRVGTSTRLSFSSPTPNAFVLPNGSYAVRYQNPDLYADNTSAEDVNGGDSGGPLFAVGSDNELRVVGILSNSNFFTLAGVRSYAHAFVRVQPKLKWLQGVLGAK